MDKGTSSSSFLGAGNPLPSIPLHSIVSYVSESKSEPLILIGILLPVPPDLLSLPNYMVVV